MTRMVGCSLALLVGLLGCRPVSTSSPTSSEAGQAEIRRALDAFNEASGRGDLAGVMATFDEQADILLVGSDTGEVYKGRDATEAQLGRWYKSSGFSWQMDRVEISRSGDTAWAFVEGKMKVTSKATGQLRFSAPYRFSVVFVNRGGRWLLHLFHGSAPRPE